MWAKGHLTKLGVPSQLLQPLFLIIAIFTHNFDHRIQDFYHYAAVREVARVAFCELVVRKWHRRQLDVPEITLLKPLPHKIY